MASSTDVLRDDGDKKSPFDDLNREELIKKCRGLLNIAQRAKQAKMDIKNELESYKLKIEQCASERNADKENIRTLQELVDSLTEQKLNYITEMDVSENKIKSLTLIGENYEEQFNNLKAEIILKNTKIADISNELSNSDNKIVSLERQNCRLVEENEQLINQLSEMEARIIEFNEVGLQQREQLCLLEEKVNAGCSPSSKLRDMNDLDNKSQLGVELNTYKLYNDELTQKLSEYESKVKEITLQYDLEKNKNEKLNTKLKSYKEKILKCASCINQLKNSRYILSKTVKEYSDSIPKWQNDIIKASKLLDSEIGNLNTEIKTLRDRLNSMEEEYKNVFDRNSALVQERKHLETKNTNLTKKLETLLSQNENLNDNTLHLQIKSLESEKSILVKEKLNARDHSLELENKLQNLTQEFNALKSERDNLKVELDATIQENNSIAEARTAERQGEIKDLRGDLSSLQQHFELLKKENENLMDLNGLLKEEVDTLKLSLEQPKDDAESLSDLNVSLQADIAKLQTKLSAYKQENASLLVETKETRNKLKDQECLVAEYEETKAKLLNYKTENSELLNEMKEINQVLKERGETISKQQKAIIEMERLIETLEKVRDDVIGEKDELTKKCEDLEKELRNAQELINIEHERVIAIEVEKNKAADIISEKEATITSLKEEFEKLKIQQCSTVELTNEDMSTSTMSKAEEHSRMKDLDDTFEDKYTKLRIFALKLKKKLNETSKEVECLKMDKSKLEKVISESGLSDKPVENVACNKETVQINISELQDKVKVLTIDLESSNGLRTENDKLRADLALKEQQLKSEFEAHKVTKDALEKTKRDVKKKSVLSLEMEDYERSMKELTMKMDEKNKKIVQMESTIDMQQGTINTMKMQIKLLEDQIKTEENQNRLIKEDLQNALDEVSEKDNVLTSKNEVLSKLEQDLEDGKRQYEELNIEMTNLLGEKEKTIVSLCEDKVELNNKLKKMEFNNAELEEKLKVTKIELDELKTEYTSYKVRAQAVLRQNQTVDHSQEEQLKEETAALKVQIDASNVTITTLKEQNEDLKLCCENEKRRSSEASAEASRASQRNTRLQADLARLTTQIESERSQHKLQVSTLTQCYKSQINELEMKIQKEADDFKRKLVAAQDGHLSHFVQDKLNRNNENYMLPVIPGKDDASDSELDMFVSMLPREEGEGSESAPSPPLSKQYPGGGGNRSPVPLERLLEEGVPEDETVEATSLALTPEQELSDLRRKLQAQLQRVKHVTLLLSESERECARYTQMNELLKAEVRRAHGSLERTQHAHNAEYMKNVTLKFVTLPPGDERSRLVPVLQKILTLNSEETQKLNAVAKGMDPCGSRGWGSYLPWPGGK